MGGNGPEPRSNRSRVVLAAGSRRTARKESSPLRGAIGSAVGGVVPVAITAVIALAAATLNLPGPNTELPLALLFIILLQLAGLYVSREGERWFWFRSWVVLAACTLTLLPTLAIQTASSRVPYASFSSGSAGLVIAATAAAVAAIVGIIWVVAALAADAPENAGILLTPALVLVPAVLGVPGDLGERSALLALGEACGLATLFMAIGWVFPKRWRPLVGLVALGVQFGVLWGLGFGPVAPPGRGLAVPALAILILIVTVVAAAVAPIAALVANRLARTVRSQSPERPAARSHSDQSRSTGRGRGRR
ncbi:MAG: hypothetical protein H0V24_09500 [Chloroflexia bacterium]|nr:hypothetical protein [Chloroflexia bacterium]